MSMKTEYSLKCLGSGAVMPDIDMAMESGKSDQPAFLRTIYEQKKLTVGNERDGLYRFGSWLPMRRKLEGSSAPITYKSVGLAKSLGLDELYITFSGYWPDRGAEMTTGTFKECEAYSVCARLPENLDDVLVVASAGTTARAFINVCSRNGIPLVVVVPENALPNLWIDHEMNPCVKVVVAGGDADYFDAIAVSNTICGFDGFRAEGGAKNVARRDGMGCTVLSAATTIGRVPDYYFQAVGSGTGAIAAWEANQRLLEDGGYGDTKMRLMVSQNKPFLVIYDSWRAGSRSQVDVEPEKARQLVAQTYAKVLSNRKPPYSIIGGLYDALVDTGGDVLCADNAEAMTAAALFEEREGIDLAPAASIAVATLKQAVESEMVDTSSVIMLNITGGGYKAVEADLDLKAVEPSVVLGPHEMTRDGVERAVAALYKNA